MKAIKLKDEEASDLLKKIVAVPEKVKYECLW